MGQIQTQLTVNERMKQSDIDKSFIRLSSSSAYHQFSHTISL